MQEAENISFRQFVKAAAKWINRHYIIKTFITVIPIIMGIVVSTPLFKFAISDGMLNRKGWLVLCGTFLLIILVEGVTNYVARNDDNYSKSYKGEVLIRGIISETEMNFSDEKNAHLRSGFKSIAHDNNQFREFIHHYVKPVQRTSDILKQISFCLEAICDVSQPNIVHSAIIKIDNGEWKWLCKTQTIGTADLIDMIGKESALEACIKAGGFYYCNDKVKAINERKYIPDRKDIRENNVGSIICWEIKIDLQDDPDRNHEIKMLSSFSTYGKRLLKLETSEDDINRIYRDVIYELVLKQYKGQLCENLIWYAMEQL